MSARLSIFFRFSLPSLFCLVTALASPAQAATPASKRDPAAAEALFTQGRKALAERDYVTACNSFSESQRLDPGAGTLMNLATCEEKLGRLASSWQHWRAAKEALPTGDKRLQFVNQQLSALEPRLPYLSIKLEEGVPKNATVWRDSIALGRASLGVELPVDPGKHEVIVRARGFHDKKYSLEIAEQERTQLLVAAGKPLPVETPNAPEMSGGTSGISKSTLGGIVGGVGLAGIAGAIVTGLIINDAQATVNANCNAKRRCNQEGLDAAQRGDDLMVVNAVSWGVGVVGLGLGTYLFLTDKPESGTRQLAVRATPGGAALAYEGTF